MDPSGGGVVLNSTSHVRTSHVARRHVAVARGTWHVARGTSARRHVGTWHVALARRHVGTSARTLKPRIVRDIRGFTLVELLIVMAVIAVLLSISVAGIETRGYWGPKHPLLPRSRRSTRHSSLTCRRVVGRISRRRWWS